MSVEIALMASIEFLDDVLSPEAYGHAVPDDARARAFVLRAILHREMILFNKAQSCSEV